MDTTDFRKAQGHWILARMGKKVLRPGGKELTMKLVHALRVTPQDDIVEFAPGLGYTAALTLAEKPASYVGVDADKDAVKLLERKISGKNIHFIQANAAHTGLPSGTKDKVYGEAMLTMQADHRKAEIVKEAYRILKPGGLYAIHELGLFPNELDETQKATIQKDLALSIHVNARPMTASEWQHILEREGFKVRKIATNAMHLLQIKRMLNDEGFFRFLKICGNILTHPQAAKRILNMRSVFKKHERHMNAIVIVAEKI